MKVLKTNHKKIGALNFKKITKKFKGYLNKILASQSINNGEVDYSKCALTVSSKIGYLVIYYVISSIVLFIFYKCITLSLILSLVIAGVIMPFKISSEINKRKRKLRIQFRDLLSALDVAMRSGENINNAFESSLDSLLLIYNPKSDIVIEVNHILMWLANNRPLKDALKSFAKRSMVAEIANFAAVIEVVEGKSDKSNEVIKQTQKVISESIDIELEIDTVIADKKNEQIIMLILPIFIVGTMTYLGNGFMDAIHTTIIGRVVATLSLIIFAAAYYISTKITNIRV